MVWKFRFVESNMYIAFLKIKKCFSESENYARSRIDIGNKVSGWRERPEEDAGFEIGVEFRLVRSA